MIRKLILMFAAAFGLSLAAATPSLALDQSLGGVNLTAWCQGAFGAAFRSVHLGAAATQWVCQRGTDANDRRPISVQSACQQQYRQYANFVKARVNPPDQAWICVVHYNEQPVNLNTWCVRHFGSQFHVQLIGNTPESYVCERGLDPNDRRPISVLQACQEQYTGVYRAQRVLPVSWVCLIGPVKI
jgi:hypothetical protein